ncbi:energy-coupling factor transporter transmembrane component T family protein [Streptococcus pluranimalium]|uniref:energy-coupling factor transporter transmembrane component T family protein n=1 Tax=Streptococcus hyovaginalis TaxID=149015 RepID=UPI002A80DE70|nr:energy-coupling factor transporter transmembrane component T [Streptococcus hyovaginalis]MDY4511612.1 energy-coupling factor transporter transmembrane component T [Streptococcus hyovaginalis]
MANRLLGYQPGRGFLYRLSGTSKLVFFILVSVAVMTSYDTRFLMMVGLFSLILFYQAGIKWRDVSFAFVFVGIFALLNIVMIYLFAPQYGNDLYGSKTILIDGPGAYDLTLEELFYLFNVAVKYVSTLPLAVIFLLTTHPSQFASSLNQLGLPYRFAYAVSLTLRYIPDLQEDFGTIRKAQEARGLELSKKASLLTRIKGNIQIITPLIFSSLERIETISTAMELRRFGRYKKRSWYQAKAWSQKDTILVLISIIIVVITITLFYINDGRFYNPFLP